VTERNGRNSGDIVRKGSMCLYKQDVPGGKVSILGGHSIGHSKQKKFIMYMCPVPKGFRDKYVFSYAPDK
jgi:hypothetical protein